MKNGIIGILCNSNKAVDLKITNSLPMIALEAKSYLIVQNHKHDVSGFQHLSIPSDLCIHLTKRTSGVERPEYMFFDPPQLQSILTDAKFTFQTLFTYVSPPINLTPEFQGSWYQAVIISPFADDEFDVRQTRVFIDFIVHNEKSLIDFSNIPLAARGMRLAYDRNGCTFGPFLFDGLQRKPRIKSSLLFSIRYGYLEMQAEQDCFVYVTYSLREKLHASYR